MSDDIFGIDDAKYCKCGCGFTINHLRNNALFWNKFHANDYYNRLHKQDKEKRKESVVNSAAAFDHNNPGFFKTLKAEHRRFTREAEGKFTFRLIWEITRCMGGFKVNNDYQKYFSEKLKKSLTL